MPVCLYYVDVIGLIGFDTLYIYIQNMYTRTRYIIVCIVHRLGEKPHFTINNNIRISVTVNLYIIEHQSLFNYTNNLFRPMDVRE